MRGLKHPFLAMENFRFAVAHDFVMTQEVISAAPYTRTNSLGLGMIL
jgi:hypothetical protein